MERIKAAFAYADKEKKMELSKHRYKTAMTALFGCCPDKSETRQVFQSLAKNSISFEEFLHWVWKKGFRSNEKVDGKSLFILLDKDFKGHIDICDFYRASEQTNLKISKSVWRKAFKEIDLHGKGFLNLDDFTLVTDV